MRAQNSNLFTYYAFCQNSDYKINLSFDMDFSIYQINLKTEMSSSFKIERKFTGNSFSTCFITYAI